MTKNIPSENAKHADWKTPMKMPFTTPEQYPDRQKASPAGKAARKSKAALNTTHPKD